MTLIEVLIYAFLLSFLLSGFIQCAYSIHLQDVHLIHRIQDAESR